MKYLSEYILEKLKINKESDPNYYHQGDILCKLVLHTYNNGEYPTLEFGDDFLIFKQYDEENNTLEGITFNQWNSKHYFEKEITQHINVFLNGNTNYYQCFDDDKSAGWKFYYIFLKVNDIIELLETFKKDFLKEDNKNTYYLSDKNKVQEIFKLFDKKLRFTKICLDLISDEYDDFINTYNEIIHKRKPTNFDLPIARSGHSKYKI